MNKSNVDVITKPTEIVVKEIHVLIDGLKKKP